MSQSKPFTLRLKKVIGGKVSWVEQSFATGYELSTFYEKNTNKTKKRTKRGGKKKNKGQ